MFTKLRRIGPVLFILLPVAALWAASSGSFQGIVKDATGKPLKGAQVRIADKDGKIVCTAQTDTNGRYQSVVLPADKYHVDLVVNSLIKASVGNAQAKPGSPTQLNFELKKESVAGAAAKKGKHYVWVPPEIGTHIGGHWEEADDAGAPGAQPVEKQSGQSFQQSIQNSRTGRLPGN